MGPSPTWWGPSWLGLDGWVGWVEAHRWTVGGAAAAGLAVCCALPPRSGSSGAQVGGERNGGPFDEFLKVKGAAPTGNRVSGSTSTSSKQKSKSERCGGPFDQFLKVQGEVPIGKTVIKERCGGPFQEFLKVSGTRCYGGCVRGGGGACMHGYWAPKRDDACVHDGGACMRGGWDPK